VTLSCSHDLTVNVPYAHLLPEYRPQLDVSLRPEDNPDLAMHRASSWEVSIYSSDMPYPLKSVYLYRLNYIRFLNNLYNSL
jgi:hypothetical protein